MQRSLSFVKHLENLKELAKLNLSVVNKFSKEYTLREQSLKDVPVK